MKTVQEWINKFNKEFGLNIWVKDIRNKEGEAELEVETKTGICLGVIELRKSDGNWRFSAITAPFGGQAWQKLIALK